MLLPLISRITALTIFLTLLSCGTRAETLPLLNVSYDPTGELYQDINTRFAESWKKRTGVTLEMHQSHGGSGKQARSVIEGLEADVVTLALAYDIDQIAAQTQMLPANWSTRLPYNSTPYTSTIVFLVRKGNPKQIKDWPDLVKPGVAVITPNPKTSGGARWNYLAAWGYALDQYGGDEEKAKQFVTALFKNVPVLDTGARAATTTFVQRKMGDVLLSWENEAMLSVRLFPDERFEIVTPSESILAEPPVALIDKYVDKHGTRTAAEAYLRFLYTDEGQEIVARHYYRPRSERVMNKYASVFPQIKLFTIDQQFGGWQAAQMKHFDEEGTFDQIYSAAAG